MQLRGDKSIVLFTGHDDGDEGNKHQITLYGNIDVTPDPKKFSIVGNLTTFQARLVTTSISGDGKETERVANIESYTGYVDKQGNFHR